MLTTPRSWTVLTTPRSWQITSTPGRRRACPSISPLYLHPIASMQVCAAGVDRSYLFFLPLLSLLAIAGDTGGVEQIGQNQEPLGTAERPTQRG